MLGKIFSHFSPNVRRVRAGWVPEIHRRGGAVEEYFLPFLSTKNDRKICFVSVGIP